MIVANPAAAINSDSNDAAFISSDKVMLLGQGSKEDLACKLVEEITRLLKERHCESSN